MNPDVATLKQSLQQTIKALADEVQLKLGDKAILERELLQLCTGKHPKVVRAELEIREIVLC